MASLDNVRISLKIDDLSNWNNSSVILNDGEIALIRCPNNILKIKIGDGKTEINDLKYVNENLETLNQGISNIVDDKNLVAGFKLSALGDFQSVFGFNAEALSTDTFSFIWNGSSIYSYNDRYKSHGPGSFQVNPENGLSGFWIGEQNMAQLLDKLYIDSKKVDSLSIEHISQDDYHELVTTDSVLSNVLYIVSSDNLNAYGEQIKNVADGIDLSDAVNLGQVNSLIAEKTDEITTDINELEEQINDAEDNINILTGNVSTLTTKTNTLITDVSTAKTNISNLTNKTTTLEEDVADLKTTDEELSSKIDNKVLINGLSSEQLEVKHISQDDYNDLVVNDATLSNTIYIVSSDTLDMYGEQIKNLADGTETTDAVNLGQVSSSISAVEKTLDNKINQINSKISDYALSNDVKNITNVLANNIDNKILIDSISAEQFEIKHVSREEYYELINNEQILSNAIYIVSADNLNAYNQRIENVADGIKDTDATNVLQVKEYVKEYVDNAIFGAMQTIYTYSQEEINS